MKFKELLKTYVFTTPVSIFLIVCGTTGIFIPPLILDFLLVLRPNSYIFNLWQKIPVDIPTSFYFFNWTNPDEIFNKSVKPKFEEVGPYRFKQNEEKCNITWNKNGTVTFQKIRTWTYNDTQGGNLDDMVTTINPLAVTVAFMTRYWGPVLRRGVSFTLSQLSSLHVTHSVRELLFEGYEDTLIKTKQFVPYFLKEGFPDWDRFGWFYLRNGSYDFDGVYNMGTGINSIFGKLYSWNYHTNNPFYSPDCFTMEQSAGEVFRKNLGEEPIAMFQQDLRRTLIFKYVGKESVHDIVGNKYMVEDLLLDNGTLYPRNKCYCNGECVPSGLLNVSATRYGSPVFGSLPHFHRADSYYVNSLDGLNPDKDKHEISITIEPTTGIPLEVNAKFQANLLMQPFADITIFQDVPKIFFPVIWARQDVTMPPNEALLLKLVLWMPAVVKTMGSLMVLVGVSLLFFCLCEKQTSYNIFRKKRSTLTYKQENVPLKSSFDSGKKVEM